MLNGNGKSDEARDGKYFMGMCKFCVNCDKQKKNEIGWGNEIVSKLLSHLTNKQTKERKNKTIK